MNDDEFSGIVRSGTSHSVSVSEHTGNAKNPKNIVTSHVEETMAKKLAFEAHDDADLFLEKIAQEIDSAHHTVGAEHSEPNAHAAFADAHTQAPNVQEIGAEGLHKNVQSIGTDALKDNHQKLEGSSHLAPNHQALAGEASGGPNVQGIPVDTLADNIQAIANDTLQDNHQKLGSDHVAANRQALGDEAAGGANMQGIPVDAMANNMQAIANDAHHAHDATFGKPSTPDNSQTLPNQAGMPNHQDIPTLSVDDNLQAADEGGMVGNNRQTLAASPELETNRQAIDASAADLNRQAAPEDLPTPANRQAVDGEHLQDHLEALPSTTVVRAKVDFPTSLDKKPAQRPPTAGTNRSVKTRSAPASSPNTSAPTRTAEQLSEHEKFLEAFHGRLAGIKHDVDQINDRLDVFEHKK